MMKEPFIFDLESNFWRTNPQYLVYEIFRSLKKKDKSKGKERSSQIMWAIALLTHPKSILSQDRYNDRVETISENYLTMGQDKDWTKKYEEHIKLFTSTTLTRKQRVAQQWGDKLDERQKLIGDIPYTLENAEVLDKMVRDTNKIWDVYNKCLEDMVEEENAGEVQGGAQESAREKGLL